MPSRWLLCTCAIGALIGISWKFGPPRREICVSTYEWIRPASSGSLLKSMPGHDVRGAERDLLGLGEEVVGIAVEHHAPDRRQRHELLGHDLRRIEHVEAERSASRFAERLNGELPLGIGAGLDGFPEIASVEVRIRARDLHGFVPHERVRPRRRRPVKLDERRLAFRVDEPKRVHAEALHHSEAARNRAIGHDPHQHVRRLRHQRHEIPERVVRGRGLRHPVMRLGLHGVDQIGKLHRVLDEEHGDVVADEIPVALVGIELDGEPAHVARGIRRASFAGDGREPHEHRSALAGLGKERRAGQRLSGW